MQAWSWQKQRVAELCSADTQDARDTVFLLQVCAGPQQLVQQKQEQQLLQL
jgi:hypothetical protein